MLNGRFRLGDARAGNHWSCIAKCESDIMTQTNKLQDSNKLEWQTIAFLKCVSLQYSKTMFLKRKLKLLSLCFSQDKLVVWTSSGSSNLHCILRLRALCYSTLSQRCLACDKYNYHDSLLASLIEGIGDSSFVETLEQHDDPKKAREQGVPTKVEGT